ncbi:MAG TPA: T9SS type A sorting domain-containing protein [Ignavibacteriaceae bacterium]
MIKELLSFFMVFLLTGSIFSQDITFVPRETVLYDTLGSEMIFYIDVTNITQADQTLFMVRTENNLPASWQSSLCFEYCFPGWVDSVATNSDFGSTPLAPNETREVAIHVFPLVNLGTGYVQMQAATFRNPSSRVTVDFTAIVNPTSVEDENTVVDNYYLAQNYPNPFNPSTRINFGLKNPGNVEISVYNILGNKVATLVNGYKPAGRHSVVFNAYSLSSGTYFYKIVTNEFTLTKKMLMLK